MKSPIKTPKTLRDIVEAKTTEGVKKTTSFRVDPNLIILQTGFNLREEGPDLDAHIEKLRLSMSEGAFIPPVDVAIVDGKIIAREGHCRTRAAKLLKLDFPDYTLECRELKGNEQEGILHMLGTGNGSKPLSPLEQGKGFFRLVRFGLSPSEIAKRLGISTMTVTNGLTLAEAPVEVQKMIAEGSVSSSTAREAIKNGTTDALKEAVAEIKSKAGTNGARKKVKPKDLAKKITPAADPDRIRLDVSRGAAQNVMVFLREMGEEDFREFIAAIETALM